VEDVRSVATSVLRHRISLNFNAQAEGLDDVQIIQRLLDEIEPNAEERA
jgi:MoxR-like ATPase